MKIRRPVTIAIFAGFWLSGVSAHGQSAFDLRTTLDEAPLVSNPNLTVPEEAAPRRRKAAGDPYAVTGIGTGAFRFYPSLSIGGLAASNVAGSASNPKADAGFNLKPSLRVESDWVRHAWTAGAGGDFTYYGDNSDLNTRNVDLFQRLRLDIRRGTTAAFDSAYAQDQTGIEDSEVPASAIGYRTDHTLSSAVAVSHDLGGLEARLKSAITWRSFGDVALPGGGKEDNSDRNYVEPTLSFRATYSDPPVFKPYVELGFAPRIHQQNFDRNGLRRDSNGYTLSAGVVLDEGPIWSGDVALTYLRRDYEDPALDSLQAAGLSGNLTWSPAELTRIVLSLGTTLSETSSATSPGSRNWSIGLDGNHEIRDNLEIFAGLGAGVEQAQGGTDVTYSADAGVSWKLNPMLAWTASYDLTWLDAAASARDYTVHKISTGLTFSR